MIVILDSGLLEQVFFIVFGFILIYYFILVGNRFREQFFGGFFWSVFYVFFYVFIRSIFSGNYFWFISFIFFFIAVFLVFIFFFIVVFLVVIFVFFNISVGGIIFGFCFYRGVGFFLSVVCGVFVFCGGVVVVDQVVGVV